MTRRCSHCSNNGHNSRTCPTRATTTGGGVKLFGVRLTDGSIMKKSASMGNLSALYHSSTSPVAVSPNFSTSPATSDHGYLSDDPSYSAKRRADRKKGQVRFWFVSFCLWLNNYFYEFDPWFFYDIFIYVFLYILHYL